MLGSAKEQLDLKNDFVLLRLYAESADGAFLLQIYARAQLTKPKNSCIFG